jgi:5-methyltetrahydrofolate--homocysteine methyltransferase
VSIFRRELAAGKRFLFDGAMGTLLQERGLEPGRNPESFCLERPDILRSIHAEYVQAGADVVTTNTFGGTRHKLPPGLDARAFNRRMAEAALAAARESAAGRRVFVAGSVGPTGKFLRPLGELDFDDLVRAFREQIRGLCEGGIDLVLAETQFDIAEARAVVLAARRECDLPVAVSMTYEAGRTLTGSAVSVCVATLANMGVDLLGMNCSAGPAEMRPAVDEALGVSPVPLIVQPNAGLPLLEDGRTVFPLAPDLFADLTSAFAREGAQAVGGCCGTTPAHIAALRRAIDGLARPHPRPDPPGIALTSRSRLVRIGRGEAVRIIGERINPTGKKQLADELRAGEFDRALALADEQVAAGATVLDVNVGAPLVAEALCLPELVSRLSSRHDAPLSLDSPNMEALEKALAVYPASPLVNSVSGEEGRMDRLGPLCRDFGAPFILLPLRGKNLPVKAKERIAIVEELLARMEELRIPRRLAMVDALVLAASSSPEAGRECLEFIRHCDEILGLPVTCGLSNISFGLPARELLNATFFSLAVGAGLNSCIANPSNRRLAEAADAVNLLAGHDAGAENFLDRYAGWSAGNGGQIGSDAAPAAGRTGEASPAFAACAPQTIEGAVIAGRRKEIETLVRAALETGEDPFALVGERLIPAITAVGELYERKEYFLPQLLRSAETMQAAFSLLRPLLEKDSRAESRPVIVLGTVEGDIHDIGKNIVGLMLGNHGFEVVDLGKDVPAAVIVEEAERRDAALIGLSALMTTTMVRMEDTVRLLREKGIAVGVLVGGAVVTEEFARSIGAHYAKDAVEAVRLARSLLRESAGA